MAINNIKWRAGQGAQIDAAGMSLLETAVDVAAERNRRKEYICSTQYLSCSCIMPGDIQ